MQPDRTKRSEALRRDEAGFTLIELLIVVAIIGIIAAGAVPALQRALLKGKVNRLASDAKALHGAFLQYNIDQSLFPSTSTPPERAFGTTTLEPLVGRGYYRNPKTLLRQLSGTRVTSYDSPNGIAADAEYYAVLTLAALPSVQIVIGHTDNFPGFIGRQIDGGYFVLGSQLLPLDENILARLGR